MTFEQLFKIDILSDNFNRSRYIRRSKERSNVSKGKIDAYANAKYLNVDDIYTAKYRNELSTRYASAMTLSYDLVISMFDVNTCESLICRVYEFDSTTRGIIEKYLHSIAASRPNLEARIIGMQTGQEFNALYDISDMVCANGLQLVEVDLFGDETRDIAFDTKLGTSHNVLIYDRLYRAGELKNGMTMEQFERNFVQKA